MKPLKIFEILTPLANSAERIGETKVAAAIVHKGNIISFGIAKRKSHPLQAKYGKDRHSIYLHAEIDAIRQAVKMVDLSRCSLFICRVKQHGDSPNGIAGWGLAKPCEGCARAIVAFDIKKVYYTLDSTSLMYEKII